ncbi:MAG TPA: succinate dehydrogenase, hydrophobic membrane anchor protein [Allosphingosinicella sp.]|nr:succinate dehydrogenase, hydrophobic membrane anchor protein [Allosphingosinicella sp.]
MTDSASTRTPLAEARGLGPAREGAAHWGEERAYALAAFALVVWLGVSLFRLPALDQQTLVDWLRNPFAAVPMLLLAFTLFRHLQMGLVVIVEDYVHDEGGRLLWLALINFASILAGALALFSILKVALGGGAGG